MVRRCHIWLSGIGSRSADFVCPLCAIWTAVQQNVLFAGEFTGCGLSLIDR